MNYKGVVEFGVVKLLKKWLIGDLFFLMLKILWLALVLFLRKMFMSSLRNGLLLRTLSSSKNLVLTSSNTMVILLSFSIQLPKILNLLSIFPAWLMIMDKGLMGTTTEGLIDIYPTFFRAGLFSLTMRLKVLYLLFLLMRYMLLFLVWTALGPLRWMGLMLLSSRNLSWSLKKIYAMISKSFSLMVPGTKLSIALP